MSVTAGNPNKQREALRVSPTVAQLAERFLKDYVPVRCKSRTEVEYRHAVKRHTVPALGSIKMAPLSAFAEKLLHHLLGH